MNDFLLNICMSHNFVATQKKKDKLFGRALKKRATCCSLFFYLVTNKKTMLEPNKEAKQSMHSSLYNLIVPKNNKLRRIKDLVDFNFVYNELVSKYSISIGRPAESPIVLFKYLLLKPIFEISDVDVVERAQ